MIAGTPPPSFLAASYSPYLDRAALTSARAIRAQMAHDFRTIAANRDCATEDDLDLLGWTPEQVAAHGRAARRMAYAAAARERTAKALHPCAEAT